MNLIKRRPPTHLLRIRRWSLGMLFGGIGVLILDSLAQIGFGRGLPTFVADGIFLTMMIMSVILGRRFTKQYEAFATQPYCESCGYALVVGEGDTCPECGTKDRFPERAAAAQLRHERAGGNVYRIDLPQPLRRRTEVTIILLSTGAVAMITGVCIRAVAPEATQLGKAILIAASTLVLPGMLMGLHTWRWRLAIQDYPYCADCGHQHIEITEAVCNECGTVIGGSVCVNHEAGLTKPEKS